MHNGEAAVVVTPTGREIRRRVGPQAWVLLEELVALAGSDRVRRATVDVTLASLVESLQLSADVIRSALRRLIDAGIVERQEQRAPGSQRFATTRYLLVGETGLTTFAESAVAGTAKTDTEKPHAARPPRQERHHLRVADADPQLSLLEMGPPPRPTRGTRERHV